MLKHQNNITNDIPVSFYSKIFYNNWKLNQDTGDDNIILDQELVGKLNIRKLDNAVRRFILDNALLNSHIENIDGELYWIKNRKICGLKYFKNKLIDKDVLLYTKKPFNLENGPLYRSKLIKNHPNIYRLIIVLHRIVVEEFSLNYFVDEISKYYNDEEYKKEVYTKEQLPNISRLSKNLLKYTALYKKQSISFWKKRLAAIEPLDLFFLRTNANYNLLSNSQRSSELSIQKLSTIGEIRFSFNKEILLKLDRLRKKYKITPYLYSQSIIAILLRKYTGQDRFCIGYSIVIKEGKHYPYGTYINTSIMPYDFSKVNDIIGVINQSREFFKSLKQRNINHSDLPASEVLTILRKDLINLAFIQINLEDKIFVFNHIKANIKNYADSAALTRELVFEQEIRNKINYRVRYKLDKINLGLLDEFIVCYKRIFVKILDELLESRMPSELTHIKNYILLSTEQYDQIIYNYNKTEMEYPSDKTVHQLFEEQVERTPDNVAVVYEGNRLTYRELNKRSNQLANYLKKVCDIRPDMLVALCLDRNEYMLVAILAILKTGGTYVPIDPSYPNERVKYILNDIAGKLVLTNEIYKKKLEGINPVIDVIAIDEHKTQENIVLCPVTNLANEAEATNLIYIIYTSGTTGNPKGVMVEHKSVVSLKYDLTNKYELGDAEVILQFANYVFDASVEQIALSLLNGYTLVLMPSKLWLNQDQFYNYLNYNKVTHIHATPTLLEQYNFSKIPSLNRLVCGGEVLTESCYNKLKLLNGIKIINEYGPTESSITSLVNIIQDNNLSIGRPISNTVCYVLDPSLVPVPIGAIGELYIGGIGLARGYLNKPDLTAERFIPNPFQTIEKSKKNKNTRLYKTGDLVRYLPDGNIEYVGRNDFQVKIRGYRIELGEIETSLSSYEGVKQSVVVAKEHLSTDGVPTGNKYLIGYYVSESKLDEAVISNYLQSRLPEYMVPNFLVHLSNLPLTINGKLDKKILPDPYFAGSDYYIAPRNELESKLCNIWSEVLGLSEDKVGIYDDFFRLGGDSILAIRLVSKLNKEFKSQITVREVFESRCVLELIGTITSIKSNCKKDESYIPFSLVKVENYKNVVDINLIEDIYPASYLQIEMLLESELDSKSTYHNVSSYLIHTSYDKNRLLSAIQQLTKKHELLRAGFFLNNETGLSIAIFKTIKIDCKTYTNQNGKILIAREKLNKFDYTKPGLFRLTINDLGDNFNLIFSFHHAIEDGWSMASLIKEFEQLYINNKSLETNLNLRYSEFIQNELAAIKNQDNVIFWKQYLADLNVAKVNWKFDEERSEDTLYNSYFHLSIDQVRLIHKISRELKISVDSIFLLAYLKVLSYFTNNSDVTVGLVVNNRLEKDGGDKLFGLFLNIIPFRFDFNKNDLNGLLGVFNTKLKLQKYKQLPYGYIKSLFGHELYYFIFNFVHLHILGKSASSVESIDGYERIGIPFTLNVAQKGDYAFLFNISVHDDYISKDFLDYFTLYYKECLANLLKDPDLRLGLIEKDYYKIIHTWNKTDEDYPDNKTIQQLFEKQVEKTPDAIAAVYGEISLTYKELNTQANQLANYIRQNHNIDPDTMIALCLDKGEPMLIAILSVLKAGGAYVPIDPGYSDKKISYVLRDTNTKLILNNKVYKERLERLALNSIKDSQPLKILVIDDGILQEQLSLQPITSPSIYTTSSNLACVIYTSETKGNFKGVMIEHKGIVNLVITQSKVFGLYDSKEVKNCLFYANYVFDSHVSEIFTSIFNGHKLHISNNIRLLSRYIEVNNINIATIPPILLNNQELLKLKILVVTGEKTSQEILDYYQNNSVRVINAYGSTEATVCSSLNNYNRNGAQNIGSPISNTTVYVLNDNLIPIPIGAIGELYIGGVGLARGYLNRPDLTAEKFIPNPFQTNEGKDNKDLDKIGKNTRLYKTGEMVRWLPNGDLEYIGRNNFHFSQGGGV